MAVFAESLQKGCHASKVCRTGLTRSALEILDPGASNGGPNLQIRNFVADMAAIEVAGWPRISNLSRSDEIRASGPSSDFKSRHVGPKVSGNEL